MISKPEGTVEKLNDQDVWHSYEFSPLLNRQQLKPQVKKNPWDYALNPMLDSFLSNLNGLKRSLKFKVSGKILDTSTYILKTKINRIMDHSMETQEDIKEAQLIEQSELMEELELQDDETDDNIDYDDMELLDAFSELEHEDYLTKEERIKLKEEKIQHVLSLELNELDNKLGANLVNLNLPRTQLYKKLEFSELSSAFKGILNRKDLIPEESEMKPKRKLKKGELPFLPEKLLANAEKKRALFEERIQSFYNALKEQHEDEPVCLLSLIREPSVESIVETLLIVLHLINKQQIELWKSIDDDLVSELDDNVKNAGADLFISPVK